jgi:hypothetical protein
VMTATFSTKDTPDEVRKRLTDANAPPEPEALVAQGSGGGFFGWLKRLFGGK